MPQLQKGVLWATVDGQKVALAQSYDKDGNPQLVSADTPMPVTGTMQLSGSYVEHRILSTDTQPNAATEGKGATLIHIDTGKIFMSNGTSWVVW